MEPAEASDNLTRTVPILGHVQKLWMALTGLLKITLQGGGFGKTK